MPKPNIIDLRGQLPRNGVFPTRPISAVTLLAVHYAGTPMDPSENALTVLRAEAQFHIDKDWGGGAHGYGLEYHYAITPAGVIYQTEDESALTWNAMNANTKDMAVIVMGTEPTDAQLVSLGAWLDWMTTERPEIPAQRADVYGHGELVEYGNATACPGPALLHYCQQYRVGAAVPPVVPAPTVVEQLVTYLSVIGDETYRVPINATQIQVLVQQAKHIAGA